MQEAFYPRIHLSIDNCFAIKRWVKPQDWMARIQALGDIHFIEASTDNEIDPLFSRPSYWHEWADEVGKYEKLLGLKVASLYSGYATYRTTGLAHWNAANRRKLVKGYFEPVVDIAGRIGAQVGNTLSAFSEPVLDEPALFRETNKTLVKKLTGMAVYAGQRGVPFSYEQMYTPNQGFWTIEGCRQYMKKVYQACGHPMYITIDTAHQVGQRLFPRPADADIVQMAESRNTGKFRLGASITKMVEAGCSAGELRVALSQRAYLFAAPEDADVYAWFSKVGCYSPIVHLQQTDGISSGHKPFTAAYNEKGIIEPMKVLKAIAASYEGENGLPVPRVKDIYLTFELFFSITDDERKIMKELSESIAYWRRAIPKDGLPVNELIG